MTEKGRGGGVRDSVMRRSKRSIVTSYRLQWNKTMYEYDEDVEKGILQDLFGSGQSNE